MAVMRGEDKRTKAKNSHEKSESLISRAGWTIVELLLAGFDEIQRLRYENVLSNRIYCSKQ